ncbi:MAG: hypothetical protein QG622_599 [Actinomycetota bacterium]|nr:hypothetical protein [Actinomycetota bacterium]
MADAEDPWLTAARTLRSEEPEKRSLAVRSDPVPERLQSHEVAPAEAPVPGHRIPRWFERPRPHLGEGTASGAARWWWLGVHGGAGVSTLLELVPGGADAFRFWPSPSVHGGPDGLVLVCRTHAHGLRCARAAVHQWNSHDVPDRLTLLGLVAIADAPGKLPVPQSQALRLLAGAVERLWTVPFLEDLRRAPDIHGLPMPPALAKLSSDLEALRPLTEALW